MRDWSFFIILEHNVIVKRSVGSIVRSLAPGEKPDGGGIRDPKKDVMPSTSPGPEQIEAFLLSVEHHLRTVESLPGLRGTQTLEHPVFGDLDAHGWHNMFGLHLEIHRKQAEAVVSHLSS